MPEPTKAQHAAITSLKMQFGKDTVKAHAADSKTGHVRVELKALAGVWSWWYDRNGFYIDGSMEQRLFTPEPPPHKPGNALDN